MNKCKCGKKISFYSKRCNKCYGKIVSKRQRGKKNGRYKDGHTTYQHYCIECNEKIFYESRRCRNCANKIRTTVKHHVYLRKNSEKTIKLSFSNHIKLHNRAYEYLVEIKKIDDYIKWFKEKYQIKEEL